MTSKKRVLMVCLGNTCRSTIAEAIFEDYLVKMDIENNWDVDSAALKGYHLGCTPDERALMTLRANGIVNYSHNARLITDDDFKTFDWILCMDEGNIVKLMAMKPVNCKAKIELLGNYDPNGEKIIRDPFCDRDCTGFIAAYEQCSRSIKNFLQIYEGNYLFYLTN